MAQPHCYLQRFAAQQSARGVSAVCVLVDSEQPSRILGFYSLSAAQVDVLHISESDREKLPRYPVACFRIICITVLRRVLIRR